MVRKKQQRTDNPIGAADEDGHSCLSESHQELPEQRPHTDRHAAAVDPDPAPTPDLAPAASDAETAGSAEVAELAEDETLAASRARERFPIVGIGASAGGLEALQEFLRQMPPESGMAFVIVTHQHPGHVSLLPNLLSKATEMPVVEASDGTVVHANHVYVGQAGGLLAIAGGVLRRLDAESTRAPHLPIDYFFRCLAMDQREHAICIVLSGTGADGTLGMRAVKAEAGMAMVQEPPSAKYAGMPASAVATGLADYVLPAPAMARQLIAYARGPYLRTRIAAVESPSFPQEPLQRMLTLMRSRTGHDFTCYKMTTIHRRIERRMNVHQIKEPQQYVRYLEENPHEIDMLFAELLISVTGFFRDPTAFDLLAEKALPGLLQSRAEGQTIRIWVPGCASGEEAYSVAVLLEECMEKLKQRFDVQIFGTDLDSHAIDVARAGTYAGGITAEVSKERLDRFFVREDGIYRIRKDIREMLVFAPHNVIRDPPFTKLDLIVCRNLLIYLDVELQRRLLPIFHYALRPGGLLFLGPSESIGSHTDLFQVVDGKWKIFRRKEALTPVRQPIELPLAPPRRVAEEHLMRGGAGHPRQPHTVSQVERLLLARFAPTSLVVDERGTIVYIHGRTGAYLEPAEGQPRNNVLEMARHGLLRPLAAALRQAVAEKREVVHENLRVKTNGDYLKVNLSVSRIEDPEPIRGLLLITIYPAAQAPPPRKGRAGKKVPEQPGRIDELEHELQFTKESLQTTIEELETSNEELKSANEELQSTNEELQSTNEELETSKEEMQSLNEELSTVNTELQAKVDELSRATDDMHNLLNSTHVAAVFLDSQFNVKWYTDQAKELFNLIPTDIGRPLGHLTSNLEYPGLLDDCREVLRSLVRKEAEVRDNKGAWRMMWIMPYRTVENMIDGVVVTFVDIGRIKRVEGAVEAIKQTFDDIVRTAREPLVMLDQQLRVVSANEPFCRASGAGRAEIVGQTIYEAGRRRWDTPAMRRLLDDLARGPGNLADFRLTDGSGGPAGSVLVANARRLDAGPESMKMIVLSLTEATQEKTG